jgi:hypothetical protein
LGIIGGVVTFCLILIWLIKRKKSKIN